LRKKKKGAGGEMAYGKLGIVVDKYNSYFLTVHFETTNVNGLIYPVWFPRNIFANSEIIIRRKIIARNRIV
jgi:hypothetical protein